jgi:hypothetical protein
MKIWEKVTDFISSPIATLIATTRRCRWTRRARRTSNVAGVRTDGICNDIREGVIVK